MLKFTEKIGDKVLSYEGETVQDIVNLKNAINPSVLVTKGICNESDQIMIAKSALQSFRAQNIPIVSEIAAHTLRCMDGKFTYFQPSDGDEQKI